MRLCMKVGKWARILRSGRKAGGRKGREQAKQSTYASNPRLRAKICVEEAPSAGTQHDAGNGGGAISHWGQCSPRIKLIWQPEKGVGKGSEKLSRQRRKPSLCDRETF